MFSVKWSPGSCWQCGGWHKTVKNKSGCDVTLTLIYVYWHTIVVQCSLVLRMKGCFHSGFCWCNYWHMDLLNSGRIMIGKMIKKLTMRLLHSCHCIYHMKAWQILCVLVIYFSWLVSPISSISDYIGLNKLIGLINCKGLCQHYEFFPISMPYYKSLQNLQKYIESKTKIPIKLHLCLHVSVAYESDVYCRWEKAVGEI